MPCCVKSPARGLRALCWAWWLALAVLAYMPQGWAADISLRDPQLDANDEGYVLSADFNINFNSRLEDAVNRGIVLYFTVDFELGRSRWYWFDEHVVRRSRTYELSYHALTRRYRVSTGGLHQSYSTLDEALQVISRLRAWQVIEKSGLRPGLSGTAALRMRLDLTQMPKTFQVGAISNKDWNLTSDWVRWPFSYGDQAPAAATAPLPVASDVK